jgi:hypothetical protein
MLQDISVGKQRNWAVACEAVLDISYEEESADKSQMD